MFWKSRQLSLSVLWKLSLEPHFLRLQVIPLVLFFANNAASIFLRYYLFSTSTEEQLSPPDIESYPSNHCSSHWHNLTFAHDQESLCP